MQKHVTFILTALFAIIVSSSCDKTDNQVAPKPEQKSMDINVDNIVNNTSYTVGKEGETLALEVNCPFETKLYWSGRTYKYIFKTAQSQTVIWNGCSADGNTVTISPAETYTREIDVAVTPKEAFRWTEGGNVLFLYPVRIRQYGDSTVYLTGADIERFNSSKSLMNDKVRETYPEYYKTEAFAASNSNLPCLYVLGTVKSAGAIYKYDGAPYDGLAAAETGERFYDPTFGPSVESMNVSAFDAVVTVDGVDLNVRVQYPDAYKLVEKAADKMKVGTTVEFVFNHAGASNTSNVLLLSPADIIVK